MKKIILTIFLLLLFYLIKSKAIVYAGCSGDGGSCRSKEEIVCKDSSGNSCVQGDPGCVCDWQCTGGTQWSCNGCNSLSKNDCGNSCASIDSCVCRTSGGCSWTDPPPPPSPPPPTPEPTTPGGCSRNTWGSCIGGWKSCSTGNYDRCGDGTCCLQNECDNGAAPQYCGGTTPTSTPTPVPATPTPLSPPACGNVTCTSLGNQATVNWTGAGAASYAIRIDDLNNGADTVSEVGGTPNNCICPTCHDLCIDYWTPKSMTVNISPGTNYTWWLHSLASTTGWDRGTEATTCPQFNCPPPSPPNCKNLSGPGTVTSGESGTYRAVIETGANGSNLAGKFNISMTNGSNELELPLTPVTSGQTIQYAWTPTEAGTYRVSCNAHNIAGWCYGHANLGIPVCAGPTTSMIVTVTDSPGWFQVQGGDLYARNNIAVTLPDESSGFNIANPDDLATQGINYYGGTFTINQPEYKGLNVNSASFEESNKILYDEIKKEFPDNVGSLEVRGNKLVPPSDKGSLGNTKVYRVTDSGTIRVDNDWRNLGTMNMVVFIDNANIQVTTADLTVNPGSFLAFVVNGNITFAENAENVQGTFIASNQIITSSKSTSADSQIILEGTYVALNGFDLKRNLKVANSSEAAEIFKYRPDFAFTAPEGLKKPFKYWQELNP